MAGKLKAIGIEKLAAGIHGDGGGLYLNVEESGSRNWILRTMVCGKRREIGLGGFPTVGLAQARQDAAELRSKARNGVDILAERRQGKEAQAHQNSIPTFETVAIEVHAQRSKNFDSVHSHNWIQSLRLHVFPHFGQKRVDTVTAADVLKAMAPVWHETPDTAGKTLDRIKAVFDYCQVMGYRTINFNGVSITQPNPCDGVRAALGQHATNSGHFVSLPYKQLPEFIQSLHATDKAGLGVKLAVEFTILTCTRSSEVRFAKWDEIDFENRVWNIPAERLAENGDTERGMKMSEPHSVPLSDRCVEILKTAKLLNGLYIFPGHSHGQPMSSATMLTAVRRMGSSADIHGMRATFKTWAHEMTKCDHLVIEASMAHVVKGIERHYLRTTFFDQRRKLMQQWAAFVTATPAAKVVSMLSRS